MAQAFQSLAFQIGAFQVDVEGGELPAQLLEHASIECCYVTDARTQRRRRLRPSEYRRLRALLAAAARRSLADARAVRSSTMGQQQRFTQNLTGSIYAQAHRQRAERQARGYGRDVRARLRESP